METEGRDSDLLSAGGAGASPPPAGAPPVAFLHRREVRIAAAALVGMAAFAATLVVTSLRRVPEGTLGVRGSDGTFLEPGQRYLGWRASSVSIYPARIDLRDVPVPVQSPQGERLRGRFSLAGSVSAEAVRALSGAGGAAGSPEERTRAAITEAVARALALRQARDLVDSSPFAFKTPWLPLAGTQQGLQIDSSEIDMVSVESLRAVVSKLHESGGRAAVEPYLEALAARRPADPAPICVLGDLARIEGQTGRAEALYLQALEMDPTLHPALEVLVVQAQQGGENIDRVERLLRRALDLKPDMLPALNWLSLLLARRGDLRGAEGALVRALALAPDEATTAVNLAALMDRQGRRGDAIDQLNRVLGKHPDHPLALYNLGSALADQGKLEEGIAALEKAEKVSPPSVRLCRRLALAYEKKGDARKAEEYRQKAAAVERSKQGEPAPAR